MSFQKFGKILKIRKNTPAIRKNTIGKNTQNTEKYFKFGKYTENPEKYRWDQKKKKKKGKGPHLIFVKKSGKTQNPEILQKSGKKSKKLRKIHEDLQIHSRKLRINTGET